MWYHFIRQRSNSIRTNSRIARANKFALKIKADAQYADIKTCINDAVDKLTDDIIFSLKEELENLVPDATSIADCIDVDVDLSYVSDKCDEILQDTNDMRENLDELADQMRDVMDICAQTANGGHRIQVPSIVRKVKVIATSIWAKRYYIATAAISAIIAITVYNACV